MFFYLHVFSTQEGNLFLFESGSCTTSCTDTGNCVLGNVLEPKCSCAFNGGTDLCNSCLVGNFFARSAPTLVSSVTDSDAGICRACGPGRYGNFSETRQPEDVTCEDCPSGYFQVDEAAATCLACPLGWRQKEDEFKFCFPCLPGEFVGEEGKTKCIGCAADTFSKLAGSSSCATCPTERTAVEGSVQCAVCAKGKKKVQHLDIMNVDYLEMYTCTACDAGYWSDSDSSKCTACPKGFHTAATNSKSCKVCEAGRYNNIKANFNEAETACSKCIAGRYSSAKGVTDGKDCNKCAAGKKNPTAGSNSSNACTNCDAMQKSEAGSSSCETCSVGEISEKGSAKW